MSIDQIQKDLEYFTYPIFQENRNNRPELVASSVAVEIGGSHFLKDIGVKSSFLTDLGRV